MADEIRARLLNWGAWARGRLPALEAKNGLWEQIPEHMRVSFSYDPDDAEAVEYAITSLSQPPTADQWRRYAFVLKLEYCDSGYLKDKVRDYNQRWRVAVSRRTFVRMLRDAEKFVEQMLPPRHVATHARQMLES